MLIELKLQFDNKTEINIFQQSEVFIASDGNKINDSENDSGSDSF